MSEGMKWLLLSMLVSLSEGRFCRDSGNCNCQEFNDSEWEIRCSSDSSSEFVARFEINVTTFRMECQNATSWSDFGYPSTFSLPFPKISTFAIERCPLPNESVAHIANRFGLESTDTLKFSSFMNLNSTITRRHLSILSPIYRLDLSSNGLTVLPANLFRGMGDLRQLDLSFNEIRLLPRDIFHGIPNLRELDLSYNAMIQVHWKLFRNCKDLIEVSLRGNLLKSMDVRTFLELEWLEVIDLSENLLETLPANAFGDLQQLKLDISGNSFSTQLGRIFHKSKLMELTFAHNRGNLTTLPMDFLNTIPRLEKVTLIRNNFTSLPENIFWRSGTVKSIDLHGNALTTLPEDIFRDSKVLVSLNLSENALNYLPEGLFRALSLLRELNLSRNDIASLSENIFANLSFLQDLDLGYNHITNIHWATFRWLPVIQSIRLSHNSVDLSDPDILRLEKYFGGPTIREIFLDHNNLNGGFFIEPLDYNLTTSLQLVDLASNQISYVQVSSPLIDSPEINYDFRHNDVRVINVSCEMFSKVTILVDDNPLDCGCTIYESLEYMHEIANPQSGENVEIILGNASCSEPVRLQGTPVAHLQLETFSCCPSDHHQQVWCTEGCDCRWRPDDRTRIVDCSSRNFSDMPEGIIELNTEYDTEEHLMSNECVRREKRCSNWHNTPVELDLQNNSLTEIPPLNIFTYKYVETLFLSHNNISKLSFSVLPPKLKTAYLDHNNLERFNQSSVDAIIRSATLRKLNLEGNPWSCDSATRDALDSMKNKLGQNLRYCPMECLDDRNPLNIKGKKPLYISYTFF